MRGANRCPIGRNAYTEDEPYDSAASSKFSSTQVGERMPQRYASSVPSRTRVRVFVVKYGSFHAVNFIQQTSNSLFPFELHEIVHAKAEVIEESAKIDMHGLNL
ncbi:hypothetical protein RHGRI_026561 [Rhododendron griersonianum]|uniref:Uncharacterized protein n=1 Tax=Rhododendron griersonianum TaxID=479676 RepID=A0AAV6IX36_9ERIC|nr:hypothetical protein RHGRI_026561 [Rhododendron griersonianum]